MIRVLIVDDSSTYRMILRRVLSLDSSLEVAGTCRDGASCIDAIKSLKPDIITLDQMMPGMDGLETLNKIKDTFPDPKTRPKVIMISSLSTQGANITVEALRRGALDFIAKPQEQSSEENIQFLKDQLLPKIHHLFGIGSSPPPMPAPSTSQPLAKPSGILKKQSFNLIIIGCSTGGPQALGKFLPKLCELTHLPILIVQHMPPMFTKSLANSLDQTCRHKVHEAEGGESVAPDSVYIAPGGKHMALGHQSRLVLNTDEPENHCRPAVDVLFRSVAQEFSGKVLTIILTGMGSDGTKHLKDLKSKGSTVLVQDEESSVVWGMPGSAVASGHVDGVFPLDDLPKKISQLLA
jgi:two-component system, chemotaxis family, protein-glutamate methylesterase/glutaminase